MARFTCIFHFYFYNLLLRKELQFIFTFYRFYPVSWILPMDVLPSASRVLTIKKKIAFRQVTHFPFSQSPHTALWEPSTASLHKAVLSPEALMFKPLLYMHGVVWGGSIHWKEKWFFMYMHLKTNFMQHQAKQVTNCIFLNRVSIVLELSRKTFYTEIKLQKRNFVLTILPCWLI